MDDINTPDKIGKTILMATMELDLGGAETHILELCRGLSEAGYRIIVVSHGGLYEAALEQAGIIHVKAPMHTRNIFSMLKAYGILKKTIETYEVKVVHAHARIPAFICGLLQKRIPFHFFTTAHGAHSTSFPLVLLSDWGEKIFTVSDDLRKYLIENYDIPDRDIIPTVNGINTELYKKNTDKNAIKNAPLYKEFSFQRDSIKIVSVSRLDVDMSKTAHVLIEIAASLNDRYGHVEIIIIGDGDDFLAVEEAAKAANKAIGKEMIFVVGARYDISLWLDITDIFVNVSRSALEAMAAEKPVILGNQQGYVGILTEETLATAQKSNFTGRGEKSMTAEDLFKDVGTLLEASESVREALGSYGRMVVKKHYSIGRMVADASLLYEQFLGVPPLKKPKMDITISGYYGFHNSGDDTLLHVIIDQLYTLYPHLKVQVFSRRPVETKKVYGIHTSFMFNLFTLGKSLKSTRVLLMGGGTLIQDLTSFQSLLYYLFILWLAEKKGAKTMLYANGIGPIDAKNEKKVRKILEKVDIITLRDQDSIDILKRIGVVGPPIHVTTDAAFGIQNYKEIPGKKKMESLGLTPHRYFCVSLRAWKALDPNFYDIMKNLIAYIQTKYDLIPVFIPMQPMNDREISMEISSNLETPGIYFGDTFSLEEILYIEKNACFILAMRLHTLIYGMIGYTPCLALSYDPKVDGLMNDFKQKYIMPVEKLELEALKAMVDEIIAKNDEIRGVLENLVDLANEKSLFTTKLALSLLKDTQK